VNFGDMEIILLHIELNKLDTE